MNNTIYKNIKKKQNKSHLIYLTIEEQKILIKNDILIFIYLSKSNIHYFQYRKLLINHHQIIKVLIIVIPKMVHK